MNQINITNELAYILISLHQICFTDFVSSAKAKSLMGWSMVLVSIFNIMFPNLYLVVKALWVDTQREMEISKMHKEYEALGSYMKSCDDKRKRLVERYDF